MASGGSAAAPGAEVDVRDQIIAFKRKLAPRREALKRAYADVTGHVRRAADVVLREVAAGRAVVPELEDHNMRNNPAREATRHAAGKSIGAGVRGVFPADLAGEWFAQVGEYLETNHY